MDDATPTLFDAAEPVEWRKLCPSCREVKPTSEFYANRSKPDGLDTNCKACRQQAYRDLPPREVTATESTCARCGETRPASEFGPWKAKLNGLSPYCKPCQRRPKDIYRKGNLARYGMTVASYDEMLARQGDGCAICHAEQSTGRSTRLHIDHDQTCCPRYKSCGKCVRGLLCVNCNQGLGQFKDDPALLRAAADYLEASRGIAAIG